MLTITKFQNKNCMEYRENKFLIKKKLVQENKNMMLRITKLKKNNNLIKKSKC